MVKLRVPQCQSGLRAPPRHIKKLNEIIPDLDLRVCAHHHRSCAEQGRELSVRITASNKRSFRAFIDISFRYPVPCLKRGVTTTACIAVDMQCQEDNPRIRAAVFPGNPHCHPLARIPAFSANIFVTSNMVIPKRNAMTRTMATTKPPLFNRKSALLMSAPPACHR